MIAVLTCDPLLNTLILDRTLYRPGAICPLYKCLTELN